MREYKPHLLTLTGASHSHACHSSGLDFPALGIYSSTPLGLGKLGFRFGSVLMRFVEVAGVSTSLTPFSPLVRLTLTDGTPAPLTFQSCVSIPNSRGSREAGIAFWPRPHAFRVSGRRQYKPHTLFPTGAS